MNILFEVNIYDEIFFVYEDKTGIETLVYDGDVLVNSEFQYTFYKEYPVAHKQDSHHKTLVAFIQARIQNGSYWLTRTQGLSYFASNVN